MKRKNNKNNSIENMIELYKCKMIARLKSSEASVHSRVIPCNGVVGPHHMCVYSGEQSD